MSLEDLDSDFLSDEADYEAEKNFSDGENDDEASYEELVYLHNNLMCFTHIYSNNIMLDMEYEDEAWSNFGSESAASELALIDNYITNIFEDVSLRSEASRSDTEDRGVQCNHDFVQLYEEIVSTSSSSSSASSESAEGQMTDADDANNSQDGAAGGPL